MSDAVDLPNTRTAVSVSGLPVNALQPLRERLGSLAAWPSISSSVRRALDERRLVILLPFVVVVGLAVSAEFDVPPVVLAGGWLMLLLATVSLRAHYATLRTLWILVALWAGVTLLPLHGVLTGTPMLARPVFGTYEVQVDEVLSEGGGEARIVVSSIRPTGGSRPVPVRRARVLIKKGPDLGPGDVISGSFRFAPVPGPVLPNAYDAQFSSYFAGIGAYGNSTKPPAVIRSGEGTSPGRLVDGIRGAIAARVDAVLPEPSAGVARSILNGDQSAVDDDTRDTMATAGIAHVLSVSGLHLTIVAGGVFWLLRLAFATSAGLARWMSGKRLAAIVGMAAAVFYYAISGGNVAALRSTLMILLVFGAVLFGRRALTMRNVALAALVVIASDPASVFRPSFQLSFAAVIALVGAFENLRTERSRDAGWIRRSVSYLRGSVLTSLVAGLGTLVFSIYHFQQTSPLGVVGNLLTLPLVGFVMMPAGALAMLAMPLGWERPFLEVMGWSVDCMLAMAKLVAGWSEHLTASPLLTPVALVVALAALGWFAFFPDRWRLLGPAAALPVLLLFALDHPPDVLVADTTQALAVRGATGLERAAGKEKSFALDIWRDTYAEPITATAATSCDSVACVGSSPVGFRYAVVTDPSGFADECSTADLIISRDADPPSYCTRPTVVGRTELLRHGVQWLRWNAATKRFDVRSAIPDLGRAWRVPG